MEPRCPHCGYDLRGVPSGRRPCPECGRIPDSYLAARQVFAIRLGVRTCGAALLLMLGLVVGSWTPWTESWLLLSAFGAMIGIVPAMLFFCVPYQTRPLGVVLAFIALGGLEILLGIGLASWGEWIAGA